MAVKVCAHTGAQWYRKNVKGFGVFWNWIECDTENAVGSSKKQKRDQESESDGDASLPEHSARK